MFFLKNFLGSRNSFNFVVGPSKDVRMFCVGVVIPTLAVSSHAITVTERSGVRLPLPRFLSSTTSSPGRLDVGVGRDKRGTDRVG